MGMLRRILAGVAAVLLVTGFFLVVTPRYGPDGYQPVAPDVDWQQAAEVEARGDELAISWLGGSSPGGMPGSFIEKYLGEKFKIRFQPIFLSHDGYVKRKPLMMMGGQVPDVLREYDPLLLQRDAYHGFLLPIPYEVILEHAPTYVRHVNETGPVAWLYAHWNGKNYGLPTTYYGGLFPGAGVWRGDWLKAVGIDKVPETLDEMHEALKRFRYNDPDGNGKQDTYGMTADLTRWASPMWCLRPARA